MDTNVYCLFYSHLQSSLVYLHYATLLGPSICAGLHQRLGLHIHGVVVSHSIVHSILGRQRSGIGFRIQAKRNGTHARHKLDLLQVVLWWRWDVLEGAVLVVGKLALLLLRGLLVHNVLGMLECGCRSSYGWCGLLLLWQ